MRHATTDANAFSERVDRFACELLLSQKLAKLAGRDESIRRKLIGFRFDFLHFRVNNSIYQILCSVIHYKQFLVSVKKDVAKLVEQDEVLELGESAFLLERPGNRAAKNEDRVRVPPVKLRPDALDRVDVLVNPAEREHVGRLASRGILVAGQIAFSLVLLIGATLLIESISHLRAEALGFEPQNVLTARIALPPDTNAVRFFDELLARLTSSTEVEHASVSLTLPMTSYPGTPVQNASEPPLPLNQRPLAATFIVTPDYFHTLGIPLKTGRTFTAHDREGTKRVVVIDEGLARHLWPDYPVGQNPVGQHILVGGVNKLPAEVIGVVADVHQNIENAGWNRSVYVPFAQSPTPSAMMTDTIASPDTT